MNENDKLQPSESAMETARRMGPPAADVSEIAQWLADQPRNDPGALPQELLDALAEEDQERKLAQHWADTRPEWVTTGDLREEELHRYLAARGTAAQAEVPAQVSALRPLEVVRLDANDRLESAKRSVKRQDTKLYTKVANERNDHPKSDAWVTAPGGGKGGMCQDLYEDVMARLDRGEQVPVKWFADRDPGGVFGAWLSSREHPLLAQENGFVVALTDENKDPKLMTADERIQVKYPGWTVAKGDPRDGGSWTHHTHPASYEVAMRAIEEAGGDVPGDDPRALQVKPLSARKLAKLLNSDVIREEFPELQGLRACSLSQARKTLDRMKHMYKHVHGDPDASSVSEQLGCETCLLAGCMRYEIHVVQLGACWRVGHHFGGEGNRYLVGPQLNPLTGEREEPLQRPRRRREMTRREEFEAQGLYESWMAHLTERE